MLAELLDAWRETRSPRIADAIDRLSTGTPIEGATVGARTEAWLAIAEKQERIEDLLATPWPGTWRKALPLLRAIVRFPDDPRLATGLAQLARDERYATKTATTFWKVLFERLVTLRDVRVVPVLEALRRHPTWHLRRVLDPALAELAKVVPGDVPAGLELPEPVVERTEPELLAAILADPDDRAARAVYGDWLSERGDPRGELIALQLSPHDTEARERALLKANARAWAGPVGEWFDPDRACFEDGMFSGGALRFVRDLDLDIMLRDPMWALVRTIEGAGELLVKLARRPELRSLRAIEDLPAADVAALEAPRLTKLSVFMGRAGDLPSFAKLPDLVCLGLTLEAPSAPRWVRNAEVLERIHTLQLRHGGAISFAEELAKRGGALRAIEIAPRGRLGFAREPGWRMTLRRDAAPGPFTSLVARYRAGAPRSSFADLAIMIGQIPAEWLRDIEIICERMPVLAAREHASLAAAVARFAQATRVVVPWDAPVPSALPDLGPLVCVEVAGGGRSKLAALWKLVVDDLGERYETFTVNRGSTIRKLAPAPLERAAAWVDKPGTREIAFSRPGASLTLASLDRAPTTQLEVPLGDRSPDDLAAWFVRMLEITQARSGRCGINWGEPHHAAVETPLLRGAPSLGWLVAFGVELARVLPVDEVRALTREPALAELSVIEVRDLIVLRLSHAARLQTAETLAALGRGLHAIAWGRLGYELRSCVTAALATIDMALLPTDPPHIVRYTSPRKALLYLELRDLVSPRLEVSFEIARDGERARVAGYAAPARTRAELDDALAHVAANVAGWIAAF